MFADTYKKDGVVLVDAFGTHYPESFTDPLREYESLVERVALVDLTHWGALRLTGGDRVTFLNNMVTNDVAKLGAGEGTHAALATTKGKLVAELFVLVRESELFVLVPQGSTQDVFTILTKHIIADDVTLEDVSNEFGVLAVEGPRARDMAWRLFPDGPLPMESLAFGDTDYQGMPVVVLRNSVTGEKGFQFVIGASHIERIRNYLVQAGRGMDMELLGRAAWNMRRVENGLPWWGPDITDNFPKECRLDDVVSYDKGCYLGQETIARMHHRGHPNWLLVGLASADTVDAPAEPASSAGPATLAGIELFAPGESAAGGKPAGRLTSPIHSPMRDGFLSLGYVRHEMAEPGTRFEFSLDGKTVELQIITLPIDPKE